MSVEVGAAIAGAALQAVPDLVNWGTNAIYAQYDRDYQRQVNEQAQRNWAAQMAFQREQAGVQQSQFERNRIGNLTQEYNEAGLNPLLAAGLGQSTAGVVSSGGSANLHTYQPQHSAEFKLANMQAAFQMGLQKELNDAEVEKLQSEANLNNTQANDIDSTQSYRINKLKADYDLSENQAAQVLAVTKKVEAEIKKVEAETKNVHESTVGKIIENGLEVEFGKKLKEEEKKKLEEEIKTAKKNRRLNTWSQVRSWVEMFVSNAVKAGYYATMLRG